MAEEIKNMIAKCSKEHEKLTQASFSYLSNNLKKIPARSKVMEDGNFRWKWYEDLIHCLIQHQTHSTEFNKFQQRLNDAFSQLNSIHYDLPPSPYHIDKLLTQLLNLEHEIGDLEIESKKVYPTYLRLSSRATNRPVRALVDFYSGTKLGKIMSKGEMGRMIDNSDPGKWKVLMGESREVELPSMLFSIVPPDPFLMQSISRLKRQLLAVYKEKIQKCQTILSEETVDQNERLCMQKFMQDLEIYSAKYEAKINGQVNTASFSINGDRQNNLVYRSSAYIHSWNDQSNGKVIISEMKNKAPFPTVIAPTSTIMKGQIKKVFNEVIKSKNIETQFTSQVIKETEKFFIKGVIDPRSGQEISIHEAIKRGIISLENGIYKGGKGVMSINEAMEEGLIIVESSNKSVEMGQLVRSGIVKTVTSKEIVSYMVLSIEDPQKHENIGVREAVERGLLDQEAGRYVIDRERGESVSIQSAIDQGYLKVYEVKRQPIEIEPEHNVENHQHVNNEEIEDDDEDDYDVIFEIISKLTDNTYFVDISSGNRKLLKEAVVSGGVSLHPLRIMLEDGTTLSLQDALVKGVVSLRGVSELLGALENKGLDKKIEERDLNVRNNKLVCGDEGLNLEEATRHKLIKPSSIYYWNNQTKSVTSLKAALDNQRIRSDGSVYDCEKNEWVAFPRAVDEKLIDLKIDRDELLEKYAGYFCMKDVLDEPIKKGIDSSKYVPMQYDTIGEAIFNGDFCVKDLSLNTKNKKLPLVECENEGHISSETVSKIIDVVSENDLDKMSANQLIDLKKGLVRPSTNDKYMKMSDANKQGMIDLNGIFVVDLADGKVKTLGSLRDEKKLEPKTGMVIVDGRKMNISDAAQKRAIKTAVLPEDFYNPPTSTTFSNHLFNESIPSMNSTNEEFFDTVTSPSNYMSTDSNVYKKKNQINDSKYSKDLNKNNDVNFTDDLINFNDSQRLNAKPQPKPDRNNLNISNAQANNQNNNNYNQNGNDLVDYSFTSNAKTYKPKMNGSLDSLDGVPTSQEDTDFHDSSKSFNHYDETEKNESSKKEESAMLDEIVEKLNEYDERMKMTEMKVVDPSHDLDDVLKDLTVIGNDLMNQKTNSENLKQHFNDNKATNYSQRQKLKIQQKNLDDNIEKNLQNHEKFTTDVLKAKKQDETIKNNLELLWKQLEDLNINLKRQSNLEGRTMGNKELEREVEEVKEVKQLLKDVIDHRNEITKMIKNLENDFEKLGGRKHHFKLPSEKFLINQERLLDKKAEKLNRLLRKENNRSVGPKADNRVNNLNTHLSDNELDNENNSKLNAQFKDAYIRLNNWLDDSTRKLLSKNRENLSESDVRRVFQDRELKYFNDYHTLQSLLDKLPDKKGEINMVFQKWKKLSSLIHSYISTLVNSKMDNWDLYLDDVDRQLDYKVISISSVQQQRQNHDVLHKELTDNRPLMNNEVINCQELISLKMSMESDEEEDNEESFKLRDLNIHSKFTKLTHKFANSLQKSLGIKEKLEDLEEMKSYSKHLYSLLTTWLSNKKPVLSGMRGCPPDDIPAILDFIQQGRKTEREIITYCGLLDECESLANEMQINVDAKSSEQINNQINNLNEEFQQFSEENWLALDDLISILQDPHDQIEDTLVDTNDKLTHVDLSVVRLQAPPFKSCAIKSLKNNIQKIESNINSLKPDLEKISYHLGSETVPEDQVEFSKRLEDDTEEITKELMKWKDKTEILDELIKAFYKHYDNYNMDLQGVEENLTSQDRVTVENDVMVGHQLNELQEIKTGLENTTSNENKCLEMISELKSLDAPEAVSETEKLMEDSKWDSFNMKREIEDREWLLKRADNLTKIYNDKLSVVSEWLPTCEESIDDFEDEISSRNSNELKDYNIKILSLKSKTLKGLKDLCVLLEVCILAHRLDLQSCDTLLLEVTNLIERCHIMFDKMNMLLKLLGGVEEEHLSIFKELVDEIKKQHDFSHSQLTYVKLLCKEVEQLSKRGLISDRNALNGIKNEFFDERKKLKDKCRIWFERTDEMNEILEWMNELRNILSSCKLMKLDSEAFKHQLDYFEQNVEDFQMKSKECKEMISRKNIDEDGKGVLNDDYIMFQKESLQGLLNDCTFLTKELQNRMKNHAARLDSHQNRSKICDNNLTNITTTLQQLKQSPPQLNHADSLYEIEKRLLNEKENLKKLKKETELVRWKGRKGEFMELGAEIRTKEWIWFEAWENLKLMNKNVHGAEEEAKIIQMNADADLLLTSLNDFEECLLQQHDQPADFMSLQKTLENKEEDLNYLTSVLRQLKQKISNQLDNTDGHNSSASKGDQFAYINNRLQELTKKYRELHSGLLKKRTQFEDYMLIGRSEDVIELRFDWLKKAREYLNENEALLGDIDTVSMLIGQYQIFQDELQRHQQMMAKMEETMPDHECMPQLQDLTQQILHLNTLKAERLNDAKSLAAEYQGMVEQLRISLPPLESQLNDDLMKGGGNDEEQKLTSLLNQLQELNQKLNNEKDLVEQTAFCHNEIMSNCHPSAIKFIQHYHTFTVTRWEQAMIKCQSCLDDLKERLQRLKGDEEVIERLRTWISENQQLISFKNNDPPPQHLPTVEMLMREHEDFYDDLIKKNNEIEDLTAKNLISPLTKQSLENDWRQLWRLSVERKKMLQETIERLIEMERFQSFSLDEWKQRYVDWIKSTKRRLMDFFRRADVKGYGFLTKKQFVEGMMNSGFETTRSELESVFNSHQKNGELPYMAFIESLKNSSSSKIASPSPVNSAGAWRRIEDEVLKQVSKCQCRNQFAAYKMAEDKYMFGDKGRQYLVRLVNGGVIVRVGGGWQTLEEFVSLNDPCKAKNRSNTSLRNLDVQSNISRAGSTSSLKTPTKKFSTPTSATTTRSLKRGDKGMKTHSMSNLTSSSIQKLNYSNEILETPRSSIEKFIAPKRITPQHKSTSDLKPFRH